MSDRMEDKAASFEALSALADGESTERDVARACQAWRDSEEARERWSTYQLIGDAMRSDGLPVTRSADADFLSAVRDRLAREPVVLAPAAPRVSKPADALEDLLPGVLDGQVARQRRWAGPISVAAGFVLVLSGVLNVIHGGGLMPSTPGQGASLAQYNPSIPANNALTQASWSVPDAAMAPSVNSLLRSGLSAEGSVGQRTASSRLTFGQNGRVEADGHTGYLIFVRDDQLDQWMASRREPPGVNDGGSLVAPATPSDMIRSVSFEAHQP